MLQTYSELNITFGLHIPDFIKFGNICMNCGSKHFFIIHSRFKFQNDSTCVQFRVEKKCVCKIFFCISITINVGLLVLTPCHFYRFNNGIFSIFD